MIGDSGKETEIKILIAEDQLIVAEDLAVTLQDLGYQMAGIASTGEEAIQLVEEFKPALVLMDIKLAGDIDGIEVSEEIRTRFDIPVIFVTAYDEKDVLQRAKKTEPYGYIAKPFSPRVLRITVETALYKHAGDKRVRESEEKYRLLAENANVGIFTTSLDGALLQANPAVARMAGYESVEEFLSIRAEQLYSKAVDRHGFLNELIEKGSLKNYEILAQKKDGTLQWVSLNAVLQKDHLGNPVSILGIVHDITERKRADEALRQSELEKSLILESAAEMVTYYNLDMRVRWANKAAADSVGQAPDALVGRHCYEIWQRGQGPCEDCPVVLARETGLPQQAEKATPDGKTWFLKGYPVKDGQGKTVGLIEFIHDITERKKG